MNQQQGEVDWVKLGAVAFKVMGVAMALFGWFVSAYYSNEFFGIKVVNMAWLGIGMSLFVTGMEIIYNHIQRGEQTFMSHLMGIGCYAYGFLTTILGLWATLKIKPVNEDYTGWIIPVFFGTLFEFGPEWLLVHVLTGTKFETAFDQIAGAFVRQAPRKPMTGFAPAAHQTQTNWEKPQ